MVEFIRQLREEHPRLGKAKLKPLSDGYCRLLGIASLSISTIGKVIQRHRLFCQKTGRNIKGKLECRVNGCGMRPQVHEDSMPNV